DASEKLTLAHITSHAGAGGDWVFISSLYRMHTEAGHQVEILGANSSEKNPRFHELDLNRGWRGLLRSIPTASKLLRNIDILHAHSFVALLCAVVVKIVYRKRYKIVYTHHLAVDGSAIKKALVRILANQTEVVHVCSKVTQRFLIERYNIAPKRIRLTHLGSDEVRFQPLTENNRRDLRAKLGIAEREFVILFAGRLAPEKGVESLVRFFSRTRPSNTSLLIVGDGDHASKIKAMVNSEGLQDRVKMMGNSEQIQEFYQLSDLLVLPSTGIETFGLVVIEAGLCGVPSVMNDLTGVSEELIDGQSGFIFTTGSQDDLDEKLVSIIDTKQELPRIGDQARELCLREFSQSVMFRNINELYREALSPK
ncbi:MAG: glycosyltransferase family 4 protein, partial [Henriciella sp.]|nr:glycosyltransferase family 4 protein [Henriciella sp.]